MQENRKNPYFDASFIAYRNQRIERWNSIACQGDTWKGWGGYYHRRLEHIYKNQVTTGQRVLEIGCAQGDLLASLQPSFGVGIDFSGEMIKRGRRKHEDLLFIQADAHAIPVETTFDVIILSDLLNDLWDVQSVFEQLEQLSHPGTRILMNSYSRLWELPLALAEKLKLARPTLFQNWLTVDDIDNLLDITGNEIIRHWQDILWPLTTPLIDGLCNRFLIKLWPFKQLALTNFLVARPVREIECEEEPLVSVLVPARNEAGNVENIFARTPEMGRGTELVFVEGHSSDDTYQTIKEAIARHPERRCKLFQQTGDGKGDAVRLGFSESSGDILMILDADLTVPPEDLPRFYEVLRKNKGEFINGVRLMYPMEKEAMRFFNFLGNKFFSLAFSWLLGQPIKDTLCGTKVLWKRDYDRIAANRKYFGDFDPFGDFDLLFGASRLNMKIVGMPIRYRERTYGSTNIERWKHGWLLLRMVMFAAGRIKFI